MTSLISKFLNYKFLTVVFLALSLVGTSYLVKLNQDGRGKAVGNGECACKNDKGDTITGDCGVGGKCTCPSGYKEGANKCAVTQPPQEGDKCQIGQPPVCQENSQGKNTGFLCKCIDLDINDWQCTTADTKTCPTESGDTDGTAGQCGGAKAKIVGRCIVAQPGYKLPLVVKYTCPGKMDMSGGCQQNPQVVQAGSSSVCFDSNFCGVQQIDTENYSDCFMSVIDHNCTTPTRTPPTSTPPKTTIIPTSSPTPTLVITSTPTATPTITVTPTITTTPTSTPTGTLAPTNTPTPTIVVQACGYTPCDDNDRPCSSGLTCISANNGNRYCSQPSYVDTCKVNPSYTSCCTAPQGPSPTRIVLPNAGFEFPIQALTVVGIITTLFGFLILL